jgi:hypothetical protein
MSSGGYICLLMVYAIGAALTATCLLVYASIVLTVKRRTVAEAILVGVLWPIAWGAALPFPWLFFKEGRLDRWPLLSSQSSNLVVTDERMR